MSRQKQESLSSWADDATEAVVQSSICMPRIWLRTVDVPCISWVQLRLSMLLVVVLDAYKSVQDGTVQETICLPIRSLPGQDKRSRQDGIRGLAGEGANSLMETTESDATVLKGHATD
jgi:hypothetical protein